MKNSKTYFVLLILVMTAFFVMIPTLSSASPAPQNYVAITLTNSQSTATSVNFQQLLKIDWSTYASDLNANISNVRFYNSTTFAASSELSGWIETNNTTTATSSNVWVNLSGTIVPASGSVIIYMAFLVTTASWSSHWGLAPQLSSPYGKFDNGANVFLLYANGNTPVSDFNYYSGISIAQATGVTYGSTTINVLQITGNNGGTGFYQISLKKPTTINNLIAESNFQQVNYGTGASQGEIAIANSNSTATSTNAIDVSMGWGKSYFSQDYMSGGAVTDDLNQAGNNNGNWNYASVQTLSGSTSFYGYIAPQLYSTSGGYSATETAANPISASSNYYIGLGISPTSSSYPWDSNINWMRARAYPPAGVMPSVSFGSLKAVVVSGHQISFSQTTLSSTAQWGIHLNNTTSNSWLNETGEYINFTGLGNGAYTFQVINAIGYAGNPGSGVLTVNGANLTQSIHFQGYYANFTETGLPTGTEWYVNLSNQPGLSEASTGQHLSGTSNTISTHLPNGTYTATYQTNQKTYHTAGSGSFTVDAQNVLQSVVFSPFYYYVNFTALSKPSSVMWGVNMSGIVKTGNGNLDFQVTNGTYFFNASAINGSFDNPEGWWRLTNDSGGSNSMILLHNVSSYGGIKVIVHGSNVNDNITFQRAYNITFEEVGIANTFQWDVNLSNGLPNGFGKTLVQSIIVSNTTTEVLFPSTEGNYINGSYSGSIQLLIYGSTGERFLNFTNSASFSLSVLGNNFVNVTNFITQYYLTTRSVPPADGYHSPYSGWFNASSTVQLSAQSNSSYEFTGFVGTNTSSYTGFGSYSNGQYLTTILMTNSITENMTFNNYVTLTFFMQNLTSGTKWGVKLTESSSLVQWNNGTGSYIGFDIPAGTYTYQITGVSAYPQTNTIIVSHSEQILLQYQITTYQVDFVENGLQPGQSWMLNVANPLVSYSETSVSGHIYFMLPNGTYSYASNNIVGYISNQSYGAFSVSGKGFKVYVNWTEGNPFIMLGIRYFVPIYLNTTNFTIPAGTQIPINIDWTKYQKFENGNLSNVMILNSTFYPLYSWIENNASSTYASSTVWVKLINGIGYTSSQIVYLVFMQSQRNNFNPVGYWGEAPQLSPLYGEWNNIAMVMNYGLLLQFYTNSSVSNLSTVPSPVLQSNLNYAKGSYLLYSGNRYVATQSYSFTPATGFTAEVYADITGGGYSSYAKENNVLINWQTEAGSYPGTWPSPPIIPTTYAQTWYAKVQGFVQQNQASTTWYTLSDDEGYISEGNGNNYLNSGWATGNVLINGTTPTNLLSGVSTLQGTSQFTALYTEIDSGQAIWQFWSSASVSYYSPSPVNQLPSIYFGSISSSYSSFYEYGLPANTNWTIAISSTSGQFIKTYTSNSNVIYNYLSSGTYIYTVGSITNGTYYSGIDGKYIPSPVTGHVIVTGIFTVQVITWHKAQILQYQMQPGQVSYTNGHIILPIFVTNLNNVPANTTVIKTIWQHMNISYVSKLQNLTSTIKFTFSTSGYGMFAIFFTLSLAQVEDIKSSNATLSMVSSFRLNKYYTGLATGIAGSSAFVNVGIKGHNIVTLNNTNATSNLTSVVPWYIGLIAPYYPQYSPNPLIETENILFWVFDNSGGKALTIIVAFATLIYIFYMMTRAKKVRGRTKRQILTDQKIDEIHENIVGGN